MDNPLESLGNIDFGPATAELVQAYLGAHGEAKIAITYLSTGKIMPTYTIHRHLHQTMLQESICWLSLNASMENFVSLIKHGKQTVEPPEV
jgi:hypothetical protein